MTQADAKVRLADVPSVAIEGRLVRLQEAEVGPGSEADDPG